MKRSVGVCPLWAWAVGWLGLSLTNVWPASAQVPDHPIVAAFERFHTDAKAEPRLGGQLLLSELNCVRCHTSTDTTLSHKPAPVLDRVGNRLRISYLKQFLMSPQRTKPGTTMPNLFDNDPEQAAKVEALVHFLASTGTLRHERPDPKSLRTGRDLYAKVGCIACHGTRDAKGNADQVWPSSVPLGDLRSKYTIASLASFLENPQAIRPVGRMPHLLQKKEAQDVANYLLQGISVPGVSGKTGSTLYAYFEGTWEKLPNFEKMKPQATGVGPAFDLTSAKRANDFGFRFEGYFRAEQEGIYRFLLMSDDGSSLEIDGKKVVDNDGVHGSQLRDGSVKLSKGIHQVVVNFFQVGGGAELEVEVDIPGLGQRPLGELVVAEEQTLTRPKQPSAPSNDPDVLEPRPELVAQGKALFSSVGCANCHSLKSEGKPLPGVTTYPTLAQLKPEQGCLSASPPAKVPNYSLSDKQRRALQTALQQPVALSQEPAEVITRTLQTFNCYACHERGGVGGPVEENNKYFLTTMPEMGDEGRIPPPLNLVGAKLRPDYLRPLLDKGSKDRPYMHTRMPGFGNANVGHLVEAFAKVDTLPKVETVTFAQPLAKVKAVARHLAGDQALGCIKCHTFAGHKAEGVQGIDMTIMTQRLQRDWFHAYLLDPNKIRPGTRMPTAWPNGMSVLPNLLDGKALTQIEALWVFLSDGTRAALPSGGRKQSIPLVPSGSAILYRNFIQGGGPRAIGVGLPERVNLAFDANDLRWSMIWQGQFIDASRHWTDRGVGYEPPAGDNILTLPPGPAFATLERTDTPWPKQSAKELGQKFKGYRLDSEDRPTFLYQVASVLVEDTPRAIAGKEQQLGRTIHITAESEPAHLYFRAAVGKSIEPQAGHWYKVDHYRVQLQTPNPAIVRTVNGQAELLVPIRLKAGKCEFTLTYDW